MPDGNYNVLSEQCRNDIRHQESEQNTEKVKRRAELLKKIGDMENLLIDQEAGLVRFLCQNSN